MIHDIGKTLSIDWRQDAIIATIQCAEVYCIFVTSRQPCIITAQKRAVEEQLNLKGGPVTLAGHWFCLK